MQHEEHNQGEQAKHTDPQENEKDTNIFGKVFDKIFGDSHGGNSLSEEESKLPGKSESIKDRG